MNKTYRQRTGIREQQVGEDRMLFDDASNSVHVLNGSAALIWDCLKTPATPDEIEAGLGREFDLSTVQDVPAMIGRTLDSLLKKGIAVESGAAVRTMAE